MLDELFRVFLVPMYDSETSYCHSGPNDSVIAKILYSPPIFFSMLKMLQHCHEVILR